MNAALREKTPPRIASRRSTARGRGWKPRAEAPKPLLQRLKPHLYHRWLQLPMVLGIGAVLFYDRYYLCKQYLFRYTDEDQTIMWYAAHELLNGRLHEPCFFGQDYNSCLEGYLAVPLIAAHVPYNVAVPLVTVILGLLPFLLLALVAWKRGHSLVAGAALLVPLLMPVRYGIITGIPRGFVTGIALAIFPTVLLLPPAPRRMRATGEGQEPLLKAEARPRWLSRTWPAFRYFFAAVIAVAAVQINPNCLILLVPVAVHALLTSWREWKFWVFGLAGLIAAAPYPLYVYQFYYIQHTDYVAYLRGVTYEWGYRYYNVFFNQYIAPRTADTPSPVLTDLAPLPVSGVAAPAFLAGAFAVVTGLLLLRRRSAAVGAALAGACFMFITFGYERVRTSNGNNSASFPYCRMYLALPVVFVWLLFLVNHTPWTKFANTPFSRWVTRGALAGMLLAAVQAFNVKQDLIDPPDDNVDTGISPESVLYPELRDAMVCRPIPVDQLYAIGREVQRTAQATKSDLVIVGGEKWVAYAVPALSGVETLYLGAQNFERRTWRVVEEYSLKHNNILTINYNVGGTLAGGNKTVIVDGDGNPVDPAKLTTQVAPLPGRGGIGGGMGGGGMGGRGGGMGGGGGGRGRGFGGGRGGVSMDPTQQDVPHLVEVPSIMVLNLGGHTLYENAASANGAFRGALPPLRIAVTAANPKGTLLMVRPNWMGR